MSGGISKVNKIPMLTKILTVIETPIIIIIVALIMYYVINHIGLPALRYSVHNNDVKTSLPVGYGMSVTHSKGDFFRSDTSTITTDKGVFVVQGTMQLITGNNLVIETHNNDLQYLCDKSLNICKQIAE